MNRYVFSLLLIIVIFSFITKLLNKHFKEKKYVKYIPGILALIFGVYNYYLSQQESTVAFMDLIRALLAMMSGVAAFTVFFIGFLYDFIIPRLKR